MIIPQTIIVPTKSIIVASLAELYLEEIDEINQVLLQQQHLTIGDSEEKQEKERKVAAIEEGTAKCCSRRWMESICHCIQRGEKNPAKMHTKNKQKDVLQKI